jgi:hypothetical protein
MVFSTLPVDRNWRRLAYVSVLAMIDFRFIFTEALRAQLRTTRTARV